MSTVAALLYVGGMITAACYATDTAYESKNLRRFDPGVRKVAIATCAMFWPVFPIGVVIKMAIGIFRDAKGWPK